MAIFNSYVGLPEGILAFYFLSGEYHNSWTGNHHFHHDTTEWHHELCPQWLGVELCVEPSWENCSPNHFLALKLSQKSVFFDWYFIFHEMPRFGVSVPLVFFGAYTGAPKCSGFRCHSFLELHRTEGARDLSALTKLHAQDSGRTELSCLSGRTRRVSAFQLWN